ncbi:MULTISPECIES: hypothetical protein [Actinoalloteichus]|uniref:Polymerase nucleotidyl transferase domain-containing protein n=1 Tax=Actinoalloteichus fjordicus TaxID=1612552 RepID=A0AAC9LGB2_9PSEU|nr:MULTISPECIES: hypothetical protein [Actinoalloteichus]APU15820.1 hypothetical protein UA74_18960 [Actinoalloteichus fjordicus]APU21880.1 hypothetical protein UA75_19450 [Actinoalloteichus sp. GBA129-24]
MRVAEARAAAVDWVRRRARGEAGFVGAYFSGSTIGLPGDAELSPTSDVDVVVVTSGPVPPVGLGKFRHQGALLEITHLSRELFATAEQVLSSYHLAGGLRADTIIADPSGMLRRLHQEVARDFAEPKWVRRRCADALRRIESGLRVVDAAAPWHQQVTSWLFPTGVTTHVLLVAALRNPTVRLRYPAVRAVLTEHGLADRYPELLTLLGARELTAARVTEHLAALATTFDAAAQVSGTPFFFRGDITAEARPIAVDGSRDLIAAGLHREAFFWIVATFARCHAVFAADAPALGAMHEPAFRAAVADLGIASTSDLRRRADDVRRFLPRLVETAEIVLRAEAVARPTVDRLP